jgi:hypothetical protein
MAAKIRLQIERVNDNLVKGISERIGDVAFAAYSAIIIASPHDTGHFRQNWQIGVNQRPTGIVEGTDKAGQRKIREANSVFANYEFGDKSRPNVIVFSNNVPYALRLNEGHSKQAASGFVQRALRAGIKAVNAGGKII